MNGFSQRLSGTNNWASQPTLLQTQQTQQTQQTWPNQQSQQAHPSQQSHQAHQERPSQQPQHTHSFPTNDSNPPMVNEEAEALWDEIERLKALATLLENREATANDGYMELKELKEVATTRYLKEYKEQGEERRRAYKTEYKLMQNMVALQEQNISQLTTQLVRLHADLAVVKARRQNSDNRDLSTMKEAHLKEEMHEYQEKWASSKKEAAALKAKMEDLRQEIQQKKAFEQHNKTQTKALLDATHFFELLTGLTIVEYEKGAWESFKCDLLGRNGRLKYRLQLFEDDTGTPRVRYSPLLDEMEGQQLPDFLRHGLEFDMKDSSFFFSKLLSYTNKK